MTKAELIKASGIDATKLDRAMPQIWMNKCYDVGIDPLALFAGWFYDEQHPQGRPLPMSELWAMAYDKVMKPAMSFAKVMLIAGAKDCSLCKGTGEIPANTSGEPPKACNKCASLYTALLDCDKGLGQ